jgi:hypothetical protein
VSANSSEEIYNFAYVTGQTPDGRPVLDLRGQPGGFSGAMTPEQAANPSFAASTTGWAATTLGNPIARDTGVFNSSPASLRCTVSGAPFTTGASTGSWTQPFVPGVRYRATVAFRREALVTGAMTFTFGGASDTVAAANLPTAGTWSTWTSQPYTVPPGGELPSLRVVGTGAASGTYFYIDDVFIESVRVTVVDRRGFKRAKILPIQSSLPDDLVAADAIGDTWLTGHRTTPFKGSVSGGRGAFRDIRTGVEIPPARLLRMTGQLVRFMDRIDPDTGGVGRDGRVAAVTWTHASDVAALAVDSSRSNFEALMARFDLLAG